MLRIFIGWDRRFPEPAKVLAYSIRKHASVPVNIQFLHLGFLEECYGFNRDPDPKASTEFTYSRFLVPYLCGYQGRALFCDNDMTCFADMKELLEIPMDGLALRVVKHDYKPTETTKMHGVVQEQYPRKNQSSLMLMDCSKLRLWTKNAVERQTGAFLHRFQGIDDRMIGDLDPAWNSLDKIEPGTKLCHWTSGGPWSNQVGTWSDQAVKQHWPHEDVWFKYRDAMHKDISINLYP